MGDFSLKLPKNCKRVTENSVVMHECLNYYTSTMFERGRLKSRDGWLVSWFVYVKKVLE